jgi:hypothetical protein
MAKPDHNAVDKRSGLDGLNLAKDYISARLPPVSMDFPDFCRHSIIKPGRHGFKCLRTNPVQMTVPPAAILEGLNILGDLGRGALPSPIDACPNPLFL